MKPFTLPVLKKNHYKLHRLLKVDFKMFFWLRGLKSYKPHLPILLDKNGYIIKTADSPEELRSIFTLRHSVFYEELSNQKKISGIDMDSFDLVFDHLIIIHKETKNIVGTYRLNSSRFNKSFYSSTEFDIANILRLEGNKLELGRACIHRNFRNSLVFAILWKGLWEYIQKTDTRYLFGCSSIMTTNFQKTFEIYCYLTEKYDAGIRNRVQPLLSYRVKRMRQTLSHFRQDASSPCEIKEKEQMIPPLLKFYLKQGAKICGEPAFDKKLKCIDFFTLLDVSLIKKITEQRLLK